MSDDLARQLRELACISGHGELGDAADAIERLTRERDVAVEFVDANKMALRNAVEIAKCLEAAERKVEKLREALREIEQCYGTEPWQLTKTMKETARAALAETESE